jgi:VWFA-related protein
MAGFCPTRVTMASVGRRTRIALLLLAALPPGGRSAARSAQEPPAAGFGERVEVEVVNLDVQVTDEGGRPLLGLGVADFEILQDGRPVEIRNFAPPRAAAAAASAAPSAAPGEPPSPAPSASEAEVSRLVVLVDNAHLRPGGRRRVLRRLREFLAARDQPGELVMVASFDGGGVRLRQGFSREPSAVAAVLAALEKTSAQGVNQDAARRQVLDGVLATWRANRQICVPEMESAVRAYAGEQHHLAAAATRALADFVDSLGGVSGRKALLWVSDGFSSRSGQDAFEFLRELCGEQPGSSFVAAQEFDVAARLRALAAAANANRVTFFAFEASGLEAPGSASADIGEQRMVSLAVETARTANLEDTLSVLAEETGGRAFLNRGDWRQALAAVGGELETAYSLGFAPGHAAEGAEHRLEVRLRVPGARLRARQGYRHKSADERLADRTRGALLIEAAENPLHAALAAAPPQAAGRRRFVSRLELDVPLAGLAMLPEGTARRGRVRLFLVVGDASGQTSPMQAFDLVFEVPAGEETAGRSLRHALDLMTGGGEQVVALGVHDLVGATSSFLRLKLALPRG